MPGGYSFRPRAWPLALALAACAAGIALGNWQSRRAEEKRALGARLEQVSVHGEFVAGRSVLLDNKTRRGRVGYEVVTPLNGGPADGLLREWLRPDAGIEKHAAYALQWYSLAALAVVLAVVLSFRKNEDFSK
jgi:cytochrome oxidase assembly protein ShyY1